MTTRPSAAVRRVVYERAQGLCEYCLIHESLSPVCHQVDHVIAEKHGGQTSIENLALSCMTCNLRKASDIASLHPISSELVSLYNPRQQRWIDHFGLDGAMLVGRTTVGETTINFLQLNAPERLLERALLVELGRYPAESDLRRPR